VSAGLGSVVAVFMLCAHILGGTVAEGTTPKPQKWPAGYSWFDEDVFYNVVQPSEAHTSSVFGATQLGAAPNAAPPIANK
jgi:hypothetical protein